MPLSFRNQVVDRVRLALDDHLFVAGDAALRKIAQPLVLVPLTGFRARFDLGRDTVIGMVEMPAAQFAAVQQIVERRDPLAVVIDLKVASVDQNSMHNLPGGMIRGVEMTLVEVEIDNLIQAVAHGRVARQLVGGRRSAGRIVRLGGVQCRRARLGIAAYIGSHGDDPAKHQHSANENRSHGKSSTQRQ